MSDQVTQVNQILFLDTLGKPTVYAINAGQIARGSLVFTGILSD